MATGGCWWLQTPHPLLQNTQTPSPITTLLPPPHPLHFRRHTQVCERWRGALGPGRLLAEGGVSRGQQGGRGQGQGPNRFPCRKIAGLLTPRPGGTSIPLCARREFGISKCKHLCAIEACCTCPQKSERWVPVLDVLAMRGHPGQVPSLLWRNGQEGLSVFSIPLTQMACVRMSLSPSLCP